MVIYVLVIHDDYWLVIEQWNEMVWRWAVAHSLCFL